MTKRTSDQLPRYVLVGLGARLSDALDDLNDEPFKKAQFTIITPRGYVLCMLEKIWREKDQRSKKRGKGK